MVFLPLLLLEGYMRDESRMSVAVAAILLALSSSPLRVWADSQSAQSTAPTSEIPRESPGAGSSEPPSAAVLAGSRRRGIRRNRSSRHGRASVAMPPAEPGPSSPQ